VNTTAIMVKDLSKHFKSKINRKKGNKANNTLNGENYIIRAVDGINFQVERGEIFGFLGPNGAGKTTTIRMMTGVLRPTHGKIEIFGMDAWKQPLQVKQITGNVPEMANAYISFTGWENLLFMGELYGIPKKRRMERGEELLKKFDLYEKRHLKTKKYSKGMKQRLLLCMALMSEPEILFLDEPTSGLDVQSAKIIKQLLKQYNERGMTIFITTHDMEVANELCDRIAIISHGKIISLDTPANIKRLTQEFQAIDVYFANGVKEEDVKNIPAVKEVQVIPEGFRVIVDNLTESICQIIDYVKSKNIIIKQLNTHQPKLEEAFLTILERGVVNG